MAIRRAVKSGNWSDPTVWDGGILPGPADDVHASGFQVTIDQNITVLTLRTNAQAPALAGGNFVIASVPAGGRVINATLPSGGTTHKINVTGLGGPLAINGDINGGSTASMYGLNITATEAVDLTVNGNVNGGSGTSTWGLVCNPAVVNPSTKIVVTGNVAGGTSSGGGISFNANNSNTILNVGGNVLGSPISSGTGVVLGVTGLTTVVVVGSVIAGPAALGMSITPAANVNVGGDVDARPSTANTVYAISAAATQDTFIVGGQVCAGMAHGIFNTNALSVVRCKGLVAGPGGRQPTNVGQVLLDIDPTDPVEIEMRTSTNPPNGDVVVLSNIPTGLPMPADVRAGTVYGADGQLEGTLAVPPPEAVAAGTPTDDAVGLAALRPSDVWEYSVSEMSSGTVGHRVARSATSDLLLEVWGMES